MGGVLPYKLEVYYTAVLSPRPVGVGVSETLLRVPGFSEQLSEFRKPYRCTRGPLQDSAIFSFPVWKNLYKNSTGKCHLLHVVVVPESLTGFFKRGFYVLALVWGGWRGVREGLGRGWGGGWGGLGESLASKTPFERPP